MFLRRSYEINSFPRPRMIGSQRKYDSIIIFHSPYSRIEELTILTLIASTKDIFR